MAIFSLLMLSGLTQAAGPGAPPIHGNCESRPPETRPRTGEVLIIECRLPASGPARAFRLRANFSGSHDDTSASLTATLDGQALTCEAGSKTALMGEDGDVSLNCGFPLTAMSAGERVFKARLAWRHAEFTDYEFDSN
jgi:hypothetical protein